MSFNFLDKWFNLCLIVAVLCGVWAVNRFTPLFGYKFADTTELVAKDKPSLKVKLSDFSNDNHNDVVSVGDYVKSSDGLWRIDVRYFSNNNNMMVPVFIR